MKAFVPLRTILAINMRTVGVLVDFLTKSEQQTYQTSSNI